MWEEQFDVFHEKSIDDFGDSTCKKTIYEMTKLNQSIELFKTVTCDKVSSSLHQQGASDNYTSAFKDQSTYNREPLISCRSQTLPVVDMDESAVFSTNDVSNAILPLVANRSSYDEDCSIDIYEDLVSNNSFELKDNGEEMTNTSNPAGFNNIISNLKADFEDTYNSCNIETHIISLNKKESEPTENLCNSQEPLDEGISNRFLSTTVHQSASQSTIIKEENLGLQKAHHSESFSENLCNPVLSSETLSMSDNVRLTIAVKPEITGVDYKRSERKKCENLADNEESLTGGLDLYCDLFAGELVEKQIAERKLSEQYDQLLKENKKLSDEVDLLKTEKQNLQRQNLILKKNISSLFKTAKEEITRKNSEIHELREKLDCMIFRRFKKIQNQTDQGTVRPVPEVKNKGSPLQDRGKSDLVIGLNCNSQVHMEIKDSRNCDIKNGRITVNHVEKFRHVPKKANQDVVEFKNLHSEKKSKTSVSSYNYFKEKNDESRFSSMDKEENLSGKKAFIKDTCEGRLLQDLDTLTKYNRCESNYELSKTSKMDRKLAHVTRIHKEELENNNERNKTIEDSHTSTKHNKTEREKVYNGARSISRSRKENTQKSTVNNECKNEIHGEQKNNSSRHYSDKILHRYLHRKDHRTTSQTSPSKYKSSRDTHHLSSQSSLTRSKPCKRKAAEMSHSSIESKKYRDNSGRHRIAYKK
ncbi:CASP8-associated protein 2-like [Limulus polyphemus]|uniref:CASP8-associated protein 2-like n=1 Tax=Limulus polyphemus TaxID=6850 RepID=A0ABM1BWQ2_LIMPO|nr:CASP8-associated protein 2-like [Limulus polyphemus]XP_022258089.1 CASP8-associated protein 2-like [Limulus polyphemus]